MHKYKFDTILVGFFISHLSEEDEYIFLSKVKDSLKSNGKVLILDSAWSPERAEIREKQGGCIRRLNNGNEFEIYKKYLDTGDMKKIGEKHNLEIEIHHFGQAFCAFSGKV